jgi:hypothetical protein
VHLRPAGDVAGPRRASRRARDADEPGRQRHCATTAVDADCHPRGRRGLLWGRRRRAGYAAARGVSPIRPRHDQCARWLRPRRTAGSRHARREAQHEREPVPTQPTGDRSHSLGDARRAPAVSAPDGGRVSRSGGRGAWGSRGRDPRRKWQRRHPHDRDPNAAQSWRYARLPRPDVLALSRAGPFAGRPGCSRALGRRMVPAGRGPGHGRRTCHLSGEPERAERHGRASRSCRTARPFVRRGIAHRRGLCRLRRGELPGAGAPIAERHCLPDPEQSLRARRVTLWLRGGSSRDRARDGQGQGQL